MVKVVCGLLVHMSTQSFSYESVDIVMDVTTMNTWISGSLPNEGFILKHDSDKENDTIDYGQLKILFKRNKYYIPTK